MTLFTCSTPLSNKMATESRTQGNTTCYPFTGLLTDLFTYVLLTTITLTLLLSTSTLLVAKERTASQHWAEQFPHITEDIPGSFSYEEISKKDYKGVTLNILAHVKPNMGEPVALHAEQFEKLTGAKIQVHHVPFGKLYQEGLWGIQKTDEQGGAIYDIVFYGSLWLPDFVEYLAPIPNNWLESPEYQEIVPYHKGIATWNGTPYQPTIDGDRHFFQYRQDLFNDTQFQAEFEKKHHRPLAPPKTWKEANEIAAFFHGRNYKGKTVYGTVEITNKDNLMFSHFLKRAAPLRETPRRKRWILL